ncbi:MAG: DUF6011 domain-containing protein [Candidatus Thorarchaeota archaeon]
MVILCKRCGRVLKSVKSIKLGFGPTCYRISKFHDNPVIGNLHEEIKFLKIEIKMVKKILRELKANQFTSYQTPAIERIKKQDSSSERNTNKLQMTEVIQELKSRFQNCNGNVKSLLTPIPIENTLIEPSHLAIV